jgi:hypothetical protein
MQLSFFNKLSLDFIKFYKVVSINVSYTENKKVDIYKSTSHNMKFHNMQPSRNIKKCSMYRVKRNELCTLYVPEP